jgi:hypothetical protein
MGCALAEKLKGNRMAKATKRNSDSEQPDELLAVSAIYAALKNLDPPVQNRALRYAAEMLGLSPINSGRPMIPTESNEGGTERSHIEAPTVLPASQASEETEGINAVALKWLKRSGIELTKLQELFSLGIDEIDLVAKKVPGTSKRERLKNVLLLKGIAAYLSSGTPRVSADQLKEASLHYDAYDVANHARYLKEFSAESGGTKETGYTLTARGLTTATELVKSLLASTKA